MKARPGIVNTAIAPYLSAQYETLTKKLLWISQSSAPFEIHSKIPKKFNQLFINKKDKAKLIPMYRHPYRRAMTRAISSTLFE